ncbi:tyrosine-type recombinase/integrase [Herpetosiphon gulosus]|uniref:Tyrosine recombinase XerC n=1 Tax=Herpetosiphon gulosus TaxID=1973496 RepID=A0ABP9X881_9CHLR
MDDPTLLPPINAPASPIVADHRTALTLRGIQADTAAQSVMIAEYRSRLAPKTRRRHEVDLQGFADFLATVQVVIPVDEQEVSVLAHDPAAWDGITAGLISAFRTWMLTEGYAIGTINIRLATVRTYARLAHLAGVIPADAYSRIRAITGYRRSEGDNLDQQRVATAQATRIATKKATANILETPQIIELKQSPWRNPTARSEAVVARDALLVCLLIDLGLRCGEVALLRWDSLRNGLLTVARPKVKIVQRHRLLGDVGTMLARYQAIIPAPTDPAQPLIASFTQNGVFTHFGVSERAISKRIQQLGVLIGIANLSPHDLRHSWATRLAQLQVPIQALRDAGGWSNFATPGRYVAQQAIANDRIPLANDLVADSES